MLHQFSNGLDNNISCLWLKWALVLGTFVSIKPAFSELLAYLVKKPEIDLIFAQDNAFLVIL